MTVTRKHSRSLPGIESATKRQHMALSESVNKVLRLVEEKTGLPVHVEPDSSLPANLLAKVTLARGVMPFHRVAYQAAASAAPDYLIVYQCGFVLRQFSLPPSERFDFARTDSAEAEVRQWVQQNPKTPDMPHQAVTNLTGFLFDGILSQLRSIPVGLRVDTWILKEFPDLAPLQRSAVVKQLDDNAAALRPEVQAMMPDQALKANISMSAAFALFWADKLSQPQITLPYQASGRLGAGRKLLDIWQNISDEPAHDMKLIDTWADELGLGSWYSWVKAA